MTTLNIDRELRELLTEDELAEEERLAREAAAADYPQPELQDIQDLRKILEEDLRVYRFGRGEANQDGRGTTASDEQLNGPIGLQQVRDMRYQRDQMPDKWQRILKTPYRFRSRLTHNEIMRVVALMTRNRPAAEIKPRGPGSKAQERAERETRWANELIPALERQAAFPLMRTYVDSVAEAGIGIFEVYLNSEYDDVDEEILADPTEDPRRYNRERDQALQARGLPFGVQVIDPMNALLDFDETGIARAIIVERRRYKDVYARLRRKLGHEAFEELRLPNPWQPGGSSPALNTVSDARGEVEIMRYYDRYWYVYVVGGKIVEATPHGMPSTPIVTSFAATTSSSNYSERLQGVVWGMVAMEQALNDLITLRLDVGFTFGRPRLAIETDVEGQLRSPDGKPTTVDFSDPTKAVELNRGQKVVDAFKDFQSRLDPNLEQTIMGLWQRSGMNPVAQGDSPGADPSGYSINSLQAAANALYETSLDNVARGLGNLIDFVRRMIRDTIGERVFLTVPMADRRQGGTEWLGLGPDDVDETPCEVRIDPLNDVNRLAIRESLMVAMEKGIVPRRVVQTVGFGADDPDDWDDQIVEDQAFQMLVQMAVQEALAIVQGGALQPDPSMGAGGPQGAPPQGGPQQVGGAPAGDNGAMPAAPQGASVGRETVAAQQGGANPATRNANRARGGQRPRGQGVPQ